MNVDSSENGNELFILIREDVLFTYFKNRTEQMILVDIVHI